MNTQKLLNKVAVSISAATLALVMTACASHKATAGSDYGQVRTEAAAQQNTSSDQTIGTVPAPSNTQNGAVTSGPAVIPGPVKVDSTGAAYTSSSVGSAGNGSATGVNTNVNLTRPKSGSSVTVTQTPMTVADTSTTTTVDTTPAYTPAPVVPSEPVVTEPAPMASSTVDTTQTTETPSTTTTTETTTHHRRMRKD